MTSEAACRPPSSAFKLNAICEKLARSSDPEDLAVAMAAGGDDACADEAPDDLCSPRAPPPPLRDPAEEDDLDDERPQAALNGALTDDNSDDNEADDDVPQEPSLVAVSTAAAASSMPTGAAFSEVPCPWPDTESALDGRMRNKRKNFQPKNIAAAVFADSDEEEEDDDEDEREDSEQSVLPPPPPADAALGAGRRSRRRRRRRRRRRVAISVLQGSRRVLGDDASSASADELFGSITYIIIITITIRTSSYRLISINNSRTHRNRSSSNSHPQVQHQQHRAADASLMKDYAENTMKELLSMYGLHDVVESITKHVPLHHFSSGKILESMSPGALLGTQAFLQNIEAVARAKEQAAAAAAAAASANSQQQQQQSGGTGTTVGTGGPPVLISCLGSTAPGPGGALSAPPLSPASSSCGSTGASLTDATTAVSGRGALPPRLSPAPAAPCSADVLANKGTAAAGSMPGDMANKALQMAGAAAQSLLGSHAQGMLPQDMATTLLTLATLGGKMAPEALNNTLAAGGVLANAPVSSSSSSGGGSSPLAAVPTMSHAAGLMSTNLANCLSVKLDQPKVPPIDYSRYVRRYSSATQCGSNYCKDLNYREHFHCLDCNSRVFVKKEEMIRHFKWHKKRDESLQHGFLRYSPHGRLLGEVPQLRPQQEADALPLSKG
ncbi:hypothetical protein MTO96_011030 [Rhipicephalus appendiculatus]